MRADPLPETNLDEGIVGWDSQDDPDMPLNFPNSRKWLLVALLSAITLVTPFASSILSPGIASLSLEFGVTDDIVASLTVSIYLLGYVVGPLFLAPLSEIYGRLPVYHITNWIFFCKSLSSVSFIIVGGAACYMPIILIITTSVQHCLR